MAVAIGRQIAGHAGPVLGLLVVTLTVVLSYGAVWTRSLQGDDFCMGSIANAGGYWEAVSYWLNHINGRWLLALGQIEMFRLPGFTDPVTGPWWVYHAAIVLIRLATVVLLMRVLVRIGLPQGAAIAAALWFGLHPVSSEALLWLAAAYGYVPSTLLLLILVLLYLKYDAGGQVFWLAGATILAVVLTAGIEQYIVALGALALVHLIRSRFDPRVGHPWVPFAILAVCVAVFVLTHFVLFHGTPGRIATAAGEGDSVAHAGWLLAWWLNFLPVSSPYGLRFDTGLQVLSEHSGLGLAVVLASFAGAWVVGRPASWQGETAGPTAAVDRLWLSLAGAALVLVPLVPFLFTGRYGMRPRSLYLPMLGLAVLGAVALSQMAQWLQARPALCRAMRWSLALSVAGFVAVSLTTNIGAQRFNFESAELHAGVMRAMVRDREAILQAGAVAVEGLPPPPYDEIAHMDTGWDFACLADWMFGAGRVVAWNNLTPAADVPVFAGEPHRILWSERL
jgi:hypothetical protein